MPKWEHGMIKVNIQEAKTHLSRYIDRVEQGDVIIVCRHNQPVAELRAVETALARPARVAGLLRPGTLGTRRLRPNDRRGAR